MTSAGPASAEVPGQPSDWRLAAFELARAEHRWTHPWPRPERWAERSCEGRLPVELSEAQRELPVRVQDDRWEKQDLLPYALMLGLSTREVAHARAVLERHELADTDSEELRATRTSLEALRQRRFVAVFHILRHEPAQVVHKLGQVRPQWVSGVVHAWLVVHDAEELEPICQVSVLARNSVSDAPLSRRLRPAVLSRLEAELIDTTWQRARESLANITRELRLPPAALQPALREASVERRPGAGHNPRTRLAQAAGDPPTRR